MVKLEFILMLLGILFMFIILIINLPEYGMKEVCKNSGMVYIVVPVNGKKTPMCGFEEHKVINHE